jgi:hypothetical protein
MAKVSLVFAVLLIALGLVGYLGTGSKHATALIPAWFGLALALFGTLSMSSSEARRKLFAHVNVTIGLLGFLGGAGAAVQGYLSAKSRGLVPDQIALASKLTMTGLLLVYVILCVRSFIAARRTRQV